MKNVKYFIPVLVVLVVVIFATIEVMVLNYIYRPKTIAHSFLVYTANTNRVSMPDPVAVADNFPLQENIFHEAMFRLHIIQLDHLTTFHQVHLQKGKLTNDDEIVQARVQEINVFFDKISYAISDIERSKSTTAKEDVMLVPFMQELQYMAQLEANEKVLYCYGQLFNATNYGSIEEHIASHGELPKNLRGITVHFILKTDDAVIENTFRNTAHTLKHLLLERNAEDVLIHTNF